jgi:hypothetical protein
MPKGSSNFFMELNKTGLKWQEFLILFIGLFGLVVMLLVHNKPPFYDEDDYLQNVGLLQQYGFSKQYLLKHIGSAGPLYPAVHYLLKPITNLETPYIRLVNVFLLAGSILFIGLTLKRLKFSQSYAWLALAIPMTYAISGLALTEIPAIFFCCVGIYLIITTLSSNSSFISAALKLSAAGLFLSLAILGRQPFLLILAAVPILFFRNRNNGKNWVLLLITIIFSLALPGYIFSVWHGLVAPDDAKLYNTIAEGGTSFQPAYVFLCLAYYAVVFFIVTPGFYILSTLKEMLGLAFIALLLVVLNFNYGFFLFLPMRQLIEQTFSPTVVTWAETIFGGGVVLGSVYFIVTLIRQLINHRYTPELLFFAAAILLIAVACIKITWGFSSRYPAQALPFLVPMFAYFYKQNKFNSVRLGLGVLLGLISFASYIILMQ